MKPSYLQLALSLLILILVGGRMEAIAQENSGYITVNGVVKDSKNKRKLENVSVSFVGSTISTVTNSDGVFSMKLPDSIKVGTLEFLNMGYQKATLLIQEGKTDNLTVLLNSYQYNLPEVVIQGIRPAALIREAISKIGDNNCVNTNMLTGFYRETVRKRNSYIGISEAILNLYKTSYIAESEQDRVKIYKGRELISPKSSDTLAVKLQGGPTLPLYLDLVKSREALLHPDLLPYYLFTFDMPVMIEDRPHYVINCRPAANLPFPLFYGKIYIDEERISFSRIEFSLSMDDKEKATQAIVKKKPVSLRFKPEELSYIVDYKTYGDRTYLNYVRTQLKFKCDWKRRLFSSNYMVVSEMVVTKREEENVEAIRGKNAFLESHILSDKVSDFYDKDFWEDYNIIEPTESLDAAVNKLMKRKGDN